MSQYDFDLFVIGAGSGGVRAARMTAAYGKRVAVAERGALGGTCVNVGCVPKKLFVYGAHYQEDFEDAAGYGWNLEGRARFDWATLRDNKTCEIERLNGIYQRLLENAGVELVRGHARLLDCHTVAVEGREYSAETILIATGGRPWVPEFPGSEHVVVSDDVFYLPQLPRRVLVVGGGYIAVEFAGIFNGLGCETELLYRGPLFLRGFDTELREQLAAEMVKKNIALNFNSDVQSIDKQENGELLVTLKDGSVKTADLVLYATGRRPNLAELGSDVVSLEQSEGGYLRVDQQYRTSEPSILAIGDVTGGMELTPVALAEGMAVARRLGTGEDQSVDYDNIATAIFSQPNLATVGLSEDAARERYGEISVFTSQFTHLKHTLTGNPEKTFMKLVVDKASDRVVGAHMLGAEAGEIIQGLAVALKAGATKACFDSTIGIHPTAAEEFVTMRDPVR